MKITITPYVGWEPGISIDDIVSIGFTCDDHNPVAKVVVGKEGVPGFPSSYHETTYEFRGINAIAALNAAIEAHKVSDPITIVRAYSLDKQ